MRAESENKDFHGRPVDPLFLYDFECIPLFLYH